MASWSLDATFMKMLILYFAFSYDRISCMWKWTYTAWAVQLIEPNYSCRTWTSLVQKSGHYISYWIIYQILFPFPSVSSAPYLHAFLVSGIWGTYLFNVALSDSARPQVWIQPQDYTASQFTESKSQISSVGLHRSSKCAWKNSIRSEKEKELERKLKTRPAPQNFQSLFTYDVYITLIPTLCFQFPEYVCLHSGLSRCSLDPTAEEYKRKSGRVSQVVTRTRYTPPFWISSYEICGAHAQPPVVSSLSQGANAFETVHNIHWEFARMDWVKDQTIWIMKLLFSDLNSKEM
jgi:hypothetical protein